MVCGGLPASSLVSLPMAMPQILVVCGDMWWFFFFRWFVVVSGD